MTAHSQAERSRAKRIRGKLRGGEKVTPDDREFLAAYREAGSGRGRVAAPVPEIEDATILSETIDPRPALTGPPDEWVRIEGGDAPADTSSETGTFDVPAAPLARTCTIVDCPACAGRETTGPSICGTTGKEVWPPLGLPAAKALAGLVFFMLGWLVKTAYKQPAIVEPTALERDELAKAIVEIVRRRAGWVAAIDDLLSAGWATGAFVRRASNVKALPRDAT